MQKFVNYGYQIAIIGDFSKYASKLLLETVALIAGGIVLIMLGQALGGIACICVCAVRAVMGLFVMPMIEKRYLA